MRSNRLTEELEWQFAVESQLRNRDRRWQVASTNAGDTDWSQIFPCLHDARSETKQYRELAAALIWDQTANRISCAVCDGMTFVYPVELAEHWLSILEQKN
ncbi:hypothetical protein [Bifidobacterium sp. SO1]|uniref:hypothetical protein n=1 Tax=Bifidobacterium sp. SO1 TaxID=2809029 RepID=UPI001BDC7CDE|nr:hypothetical protein [Bifidobacterium sp. SO1]MBT1162132.1 hypothetical protein [Bifidobacterium sp. SO1]